MNTLIYWFGRAFIALIQALPLPLVARLGRCGGGLTYHLTSRYRRVVLDNLTMCFSNEKSPAEIIAIAKENFRRIGENYATAIKTAAMSFDELKPHLDFSGFEHFPKKVDGKPLPNAVMAIGHFGNFELYARIQDLWPDYRGCTTYRALKQPAMNRLLQTVHSVWRANDPSGSSGVVWYALRLPRPNEPHLGHAGCVTNTYRNGSPSGGSSRRRRRSLSS